MRLNKAKKIYISVAVAAVILGAAGLQNLWASVSYVKPMDAGHQVEIASKKEIPAVVSQESKSKAPEPSTVALFGSGILGMLVSFVRKTYAATKRVLDVIGSIIGIILSAPFMLLAAVLVKLTSKGPIIYSQTRVGKDGAHFEIYKFRTMKVDAEKTSGPVWAKANDNRLTPIGGFLRKAHLDELPQLFNVLRGEMSLIGPRPERPVFVEKLKNQVSGYENRLVIKPGITGLAQVWHRYDETIEDVKKKIKYDVLYIKRMCLMADLDIALRTVVVVLTGKGAR